MKVCFPVQLNEGIESKVFGHFGSAPLFMVVDMLTGEVVEAINRDLNHAHGACQPVKALGDQQIDAVVVGGIGGGALRGLTQAGIRVFKAQAATIAENAKLLSDGALSKWQPGQVCGGHGHGKPQGGQGHGHGNGCCG